jgi:hypothetical protein
VVDRGLAMLREAAALNGLKESGELSNLCEETGVAFLRRARLPAAPAAASDLDSAQAWLDMATAMRTRTSGRGYWNLCRSRSEVYEARAGQARSDRERQLLLRRAMVEMGRSMLPLGEPEDEFEREISRCDLAGLTAQLAASTGDRALFARADSLLAAGALLAHSTHYPLQYAGRELRRAQVFRMRWETFGAAADWALASEALARARGAVPAAEFPSWHRLIDEQMRALAKGRPGKLAWAPASTCAGASLADA